MPRDIVGGDILFMEPINDGVVIALMDCTGHGVPGAFMTVIACMSFHQLVRLEGYRNPAAILKQLNSMVKSSLQQDSKSTLSDDGLDAGICRLTPRENRLVFAGARIPLYYTKDNEVITIKGDRHSIGYKKSDIDFDFTSHKVTIEDGMSFYMTSDGLIHQLGGEKRLPFGTRRFREILKQHHGKPFETQKQILLKEFDDYKGSNERLDDVTVVGFACS
jgi:serine phosphatase RsbU (regulator of sigma subunit)